MALGPDATVYLLAFVPAVIWGFTPVLDKRGMSLSGTALQASLTVVVVDLTLFVLALLLLRGPALLAGLDLAVAGLFLFAGMTGTALGRLAIFVGVDRVGASINSAVVSARPLFATALAFGLLGEPVSLATGVGIVVLVAGLAILSLSKGGDISGWETRDLAYPLASGTLFAFGNVLRRLGLGTDGADVLQAVALNEAGALLVFLGYAAVSGTAGFRSAERRSYLYFAGSGVLTAVALLSMFGALALPAGRVAIVESLASTAPLFTTVFAYFFLKDLERVTRGIVLGAVLVVIGVVFVTVEPGLFL
ncbi:DMT family transporter [Halodesulfurarchaeum sp. HSR-GB]|uniref:DMT family transporter n=1 Tax=Halodesulfurarchaeum sp. HSR-GB TaxID=3074077 RepID=UPI0028563223|nr:DMT family transporter [Halodesulfurarchaeum sp. HSR-GB]MDR5655850.1 DMT family transporter [Halodesulfurarchaeum sp. HSR-GB]